MPANFGQKIKYTMHILNKNIKNSINYTALLFLFSVSIVGYAEPTPLEQENIRLKHQENLKLSNDGIEQATSLRKDGAIETSVDKNVDQTLPLIKQISIDTEIGVYLTEFNEIIAQYIGTNLTTTQIYNLSKDLTQALYQAGYVTSAIGLKTDVIENGYIPFVVHWGKVDQLYVNGKLPKDFKDRGMLWVLPTLQEMPLNIFQIDQLIEILNTTNKKASIDVSASDKISYSNLNFLVKRSLLPAMQIGFNNSGTGNNANGRNQATLAWQVGDLLGLNDSWSFSTGYRFYKNHQANNQINYSISYSQPISTYTLDTRLNQSSYEKEIKGSFGSYSSEGKTKSLNLKLSKVLMRNKESIFSIYSELEFKKRITFIVNRQALNRNEYKINLGISYISQLVGGRLYTDLNYANGLNWFNGKKLAYEQNKEKTLKALSANLTWSKLFAIKQKPLNYQLRLGGQYSTDALYSENQFSIGDEYTVKGFKGGALSGEKGIYASQTLTLIFQPNKFYIQQIAPFVGLDIGEVYQKVDNSKEVISGFAIGAKSTIGGLSLSLTYARPLHTISNQSKKPVIYVNGSISF